MEKTKIKKKRTIKILAIIIGAILLAATLLCLAFVDNKNIDYEYFELKSQIIGTHAIKIVHLSDLHFPKIKVNIDELVSKILSEQPHILAITGDLVDSNAKVPTSGVVDFIEKIKNVAPIYYVYGNHETRNTENYSAINLVLKQNDVTILNNESVNLKIDDKEITIIGLSDNGEYSKALFAKNLSAVTNYKILLAHRPEKWEHYCSQEKEFQPHLILTGHAHGGQFRLFGQGLVAPDQGVFPKYDGGLYQTADKSCTMIVSRGIGNSLFSFRFNNKPNIPIITIKN